MFYAQAEEFAQAAEFELRWLSSNPKDDSSRLRTMDLLLRAGQAKKADNTGAVLPGARITASSVDTGAEAGVVAELPLSAELEVVVRLHPGECRAG
jgi:hypothetical protein